MNPNMQRARKLGTNMTHHHIGALPSQRPATWLEIQPKLRLFATSGTRCSSAGGCGTTSGIALAVITLSLSLPLYGSTIPYLRRDSHFFARTFARSSVLPSDRYNPAWQDSGCAPSPSTSGEVWSIEIPKRCSLAPVA